MLFLCLLRQWASLVDQQIRLISVVLLATSLSSSFALVDHNVVGVVVAAVVCHVLVKFCNCSCLLWLLAVCMFLYWGFPTGLMKRHLLV